MNIISTRVATIIVTSLVIAIAIILSPTSRYLASSRSFAQRLYSRSSTASVSSSAKISSHLISTPLNMTGRTPVYFLSHGGVSLSYYKCRNMWLTKNYSQTSCMKRTILCILCSRKSARRSRRMSNQMLSLYSQHTGKANEM